jgi:hypothetical protein
MLGGFLSAQSCRERNEHKCMDTHGFRQPHQQVSPCLRDSLLGELFKPVERAVRLLLQGQRSLQLTSKLCMVCMYSQAVSGPSQRGGPCLDWHGMARHVNAGQGEGQGKARRGLNANPYLVSKTARHDTIRCSFHRIFSRVLAHFPWINRSIFSIDFEQTKSNINQVWNAFSLLVLAIFNNWSPFR